MFYFSNSPIPFVITFVFILFMTLKKMKIDFIEVLNFYFKLQNEENKGEEGSDENNVKLDVVRFEDKYKEEVKQKSANKKELSEERKKSLKNSFVFENTPVGNVLMFYDSERETFRFYSDHTVPYRYLEVVSRKYVLVNDCLPLYVNMEDELKEAEKRRDIKKELKEKIKNEKKVDAVEEKRGVFAKLKKYNRSESKSQIIQGSKKSAIPNQYRMNSQQVNISNEDIIVKENSNRYSCEGTLANFSFLEKVDRKVIEPRYAMSFAEFKKRIGGNKKIN